MTDSQGFNHSYGHAFRYDGVIYYSPNCSQVFPVPPQPYSRAYPFRLTTDCYAKYLDIDWVADPLGYLALTPLDTGLFSRPLFSCLQDFERNIVRLDNRKYGLEPSVEAKWLDLELRFLIVTKFLNTHAKFPTWRPPLVMDTGMATRNGSWVRVTTGRGRV